MTTDPPDLADPWPPLPDDGDADTAEWTPRPADDWTVRAAQQAAEELRYRALELAVQTLDVVDATTGRVPETVAVVLDTAESYLAWIETGRRPDGAAMGGTE
jgi:hypothetical protein